jgi:pimeloyl-ACP methyl ester carboxylesterase
MKFSFRLLTRIFFLIFVLGLFAVGGILAWFTSWRSDRLAALDSASEIAKTSYGDVEYVRQGEGPAVLVFHGAPGGYDQAALMGERLIEAGMQVIAPSRPGYLRTPLDGGLTPEQQADLMAALLDTLGVQQVAVMGASAGAPAAIQFALRHPQRLRTLVLISPMLKRWVPNPETAQFGRLVLGHLTGDVGSWLAVEGVARDPRRVLEGFLEFSSRGDATEREIIVRSVLNDPAQLEWFRDWIGTFAPLSPRESGTRNDLLQLSALPAIPFGKISVPTLVILGAEDPCVPLEEAQIAVKKIPTATLFTAEGAGHLVEIGPQAVQVNEAIRKFLNQRVPNSGAAAAETDQN